MSRLTVVNVVFFWPWDDIVACSIRTFYFQEQGANRRKRNTNPIGKILFRCLDADDSMFGFGAAMITFFTFSVSSTSIWLSSSESCCARSLSPESSLSALSTRTIGFGWTSCTVFTVTGRLVDALVISEKRETKWNIANKEKIQCDMLRKKEKVDRLSRYSILFSRLKKPDSLDYLSLSLLDD